MIALVLVVGIAVALCVAGWVPLVRAAVRVDSGPVGSALREAAPVLAAATPEPLDEPVSA